MKHLAKALLLAGPITIVIFAIISWIISIISFLITYAIVAMAILWVDRKAARSQELPDATGPSTTSLDLRR